MSDYRITYYQTVVNQCHELRTAIRKLAGLDYPYPVRVVSDPDRPAPRAEGSRGYFTTPSGKTIVHHPSAYGWPTVYCHSTVTADVDIDWIAQHLMDIIRPVRTYPCRPEIMGPSGEDDQVQIRRPRIVARSHEGMMICDRPRWWDPSTVVQIVVQDATTGHRHHLTVPPAYCRPLADSESWSQRIHAAIAWTFELDADQYRPSLCS